MNLDKLIMWATAIVTGFAAMGKLDTLQLWIWTAQAKVVYESRTSTWGSPRFFGKTTGGAPPKQSSADKN